MDGLSPDRGADTSGNSLSRRHAICVAGRVTMHHVGDEDLRFRDARALKTIVNQFAASSGEIAFCPVGLAPGVLVLRNRLQQCFNCGVGEAFGSGLARRPPQRRRLQVSDTARTDRPTDSHTRWSGAARGLKSWVSSPWSLAASSPRSMGARYTQRAAPSRSAGRLRRSGR